MAAHRTRELLLEHGALLFARHGVAGVTARQLHEAVGARNESALHYHFGGKEGLALAILRGHLEAVEGRRARLVAAIVADERPRDLRALVHALAAPMADDLGTALGRAHLRLVAMMDQPAMAFASPFRLVEAPAGVAVVRWLGQALAHVPEPVRVERLAALRSQLIGLMAQRARLLDDDPAARGAGSSDLFLHNLVDMLVAGLAVEPSSDTLVATAEVEGRAGTVSR